MPLSRSDVLMVKQAANQNWAVPMPVREAIVEEFREVFDANARSSRLCLSVFNAAIAMEGANMRAQ